MKVGDLVQYGDWYTGKQKMGLILKMDDHGSRRNWFLVCWPTHIEWEGSEEIEVMNEKI